MVTSWAKGKHFSEEHKRKIGEANSKRIVSEETKKKIGESRKKLFATSPEAHVHLSNAMKGKVSSRKGAVLTDETKRKISEARKGKCVGKDNPNFGRVFSDEHRTKLSIARIGKPGRLGVPQSESAKEKLRIFHTGMKATTETKRKMRASQLIAQNKPERLEQLRSASLGEQNHNWTGGTTKYCKKFRSGTFRHRVRAFWGNVCQICGEPTRENESLDVHHVYYNKKACCEVSPDGKYYSDLGLKGHPKDFEIMGDPNKFVPLHHECHSKTITKRARPLYARLFEKIINEERGGKCYFTEDEYYAITQ